MESFIAESVIVNVNVIEKFPGAGEEQPCLGGPQTPTGRHRLKMPRKTGTWTGLVFKA